METTESTRKALLSSRLRGFCNHLVDEFDAITSFTVCIYKRGGNDVYSQESASYPNEKEAERWFENYVRHELKQKPSNPWQRGLHKAFDAFATRSKRKAHLLNALSWGSTLLLGIGLGIVLTALAYVKAEGLAK